MTEFPKTYNPKEVEDKIYQKWEQSGFFNPDRLEEAHDRYWKAEPYSIAMPPPNITAELHVGQSLVLTLEDLMIRHARMSGKKTLWLPGTDHAAIATQNVVERQIWEKEKKTRHDIGRQELLRCIEEFIAKTRGRIQHQIRKMGASCDWSREKYTLSPELSRSVRTAFKKMYDQGLIYRGDRIVNWCPRCGTTLADDEVEYQETAGNLYYIHYPLSKGKGALTVATTRPETMLGDTAVGVHPDDFRYKKYIGQSLMLPLLNRELPIIADQGVDKDFGTGVLKITPGHDPHDFEIGQRHHLEIINLFNPDGKINGQEAFDHGFEDYAGLTAEEAREKIVKALSEENYLEKVEDFKHNMGFCYRCETIVEPLISKQWFINVNAKCKMQNAKFQKQLQLRTEASLKEIATAAVKNGAIKIVPERFAKVYLQWMENLRDWNISRQIWFGHQIPVWYCGKLQTEVLPKMGFCESVVSEVLAGKTKTYRLRDHQLKIGDQLAFENSQTRTVFGYGTIINIEKTTAQEIDLADPTHGATYDNREQLLKRFRLHYPDRKVFNNTKVLIYTYEFTPAEKQTEGCGGVIVSIEEPDKCPNCNSPSLTQDPDTLDTWFSSSLWTFSTLGWPEQTPDLATYHPTTVLETGYDILFFWVARMILMTGFVLEDIPFQTVYLNGLVRDKYGKKMSKSLGNALNPLEIIKKYGTDSLRLSLVMGTTPGNDLKIYEEKIQSYRNFANKLWNIARFILQQTPEIKIKEEKPEAQSLADHWILEELNQLISGVEKDFSNYQYGLAAETLTTFTWNKFADWYLEISKIKNQKSNSKEILPYILEQLLKLWHPFIPFVTEYIWSLFSSDLLMVQEYPTSQNSIRRGGPNSKSIKNFQQLQELITGLRNLRALYHQDPKKTFAAYLDLPKELNWIREQTPVIEKLARVKLNFAAIEENRIMPYFLWKNAKVYLIVPDFDPDKELALAEKELKEIKDQIRRLHKQLDKTGFREKAPAEIVEKVEASYKEIKEREKKLKAKIEALE